VREGRFREDLFARINLWTFRLPGLRDRLEDVEPNLQYELEQYARRTSSHVTFNKEARERFLRFATSPEARWAGNFRDLNGAVIRMATLAQGGRISVEVVDEEIERLRTSWRMSPAGDCDNLLSGLLDKEQMERLDLFDRLQLEEVIRVCQESRTLSEAGRKLFDASRGKKRTANDADRLRKYLARFSLEWSRVRAASMEADLP
jgi:transcriptional regulatory protein RtcR